MVEKVNKLIVICMVGAPCSGKSTWVLENTPKLQEHFDADVIVISRDIIRETEFGVKYVETPKEEAIVTNKFYDQLRRAMTLNKAVIVLDNTHMTNRTIDSYISTFGPLINSGKMEFYIKFLKIPYYMMKLRNFWRHYKTGRYINTDVLMRFYNMYNNLNIKKYQQWETF